MMTKPMLTPTPTPTRNAEKYHERRIRKGMEEHYKEMGMVSVVFAVYTRQDGKMAVNV
jgi:hypothetical protein